MRLDENMRSDISDISFFTDMGYIRKGGGFMSRPFITQEKEKKLKGLLALLKGAGTTKEIIEIKQVSAKELVGLMELLLSEKPIVLDEDLTPSEAAKILGISRPLVVHLLETKKIEGYHIGVGTHWKAKRNSVLKYLEERDELSKAFGEMDKAGFGLD